MIQLYTDTSANLPLALIKQHHLKVVSFSYYVNGEKAVYDETLDFDGEAFYGAMRADAQVTTSLINVGDFIDRFEEDLSAGNDVLYIGMSGGISGTANAAAVAVSELREKYKQRRIAAIDTYAASLGEGLLVLMAAQMLAAGALFDGIRQKIETCRHTMCQYFTVDDLEYLKKGGRISGAAALIGNLLGIKPILMGDEQGHIVLCDKVRGSARALEHLAEKYLRLAADKAADIGIAHADNPAGAQSLLDKLRARGLTGDCLTVCYEPVTGAHVGPGTVALFFPGTKK
ncbi:MAG: DegV family protein [Oscillospiraceae bacterium]|nr:DegV family protein [Oscillospiraceae bacterium]